MERFSTKVVLGNGMQRKLFLDIKKREWLSQRSLAKLLKVSRSGVKHWSSEERKLPQSIFERLITTFPWASEYRKCVLEILPRNWVQIKGGNIRSKMKNNLTRKDRIRGFRKARLWIGRRKVVGPNGELMFNEGEKRIAEEFVKNNIKYVYEPLIPLGKNYAIPDFVVRNVIVERCGYGDWKPYWLNLKMKIRRLERYEDYSIVILVPSRNFSLAARELDGAKITLLKEENLEHLLDLLKTKHVDCQVVESNINHGMKFTHGSKTYGSIN